MTSRLTSSDSTRPSALVVTCPGLRLPTWNAILGMGLRARMAEKKRVRECVSRYARIALASQTRMA